MPLSENQIEAAANGLGLGCEIINGCKIENGGAGRDRIFRNGIGSSTRSSFAA